MTTKDQLTNLAEVAVSTSKKRKTANSSHDANKESVSSNANKESDVQTKTDSNQDNPPNTPNSPTIAQQFSNLSILRNLLDVKEIYIAQTLAAIDQRRRQFDAIPTSDEMAKFNNIVGCNNKTLEKYSGVYNPDFVLQTQLLDCKEIYLKRLADYVDHKIEGKYEEDRILMVRAQLNHLNAVIQTEMSLLALEIANNNDI